MAQKREPLAMLRLSLLCPDMETIYVRSGDETYKKMAQFWGKLFVVNFVLGAAFRPHLVEDGGLLAKYVLKG
jgi:hypothetical protein